MTRFVCTVVAGMLLFPALLSAVEPITLESLLTEMGDLDRLAQHPDDGYRSLQASSYNRRSTHRDKPGWFADQDGVGFIRTEQVNGKTEWVIMEHDGPGCLTKMWTPFFYYGFGNRVGPRIRIYLDGAETPTIDETFIELLTRNDWPASYGAKPPQSAGLQVPSPFADFTARAGNLYLPIPFAESCKITLTGKAFYNIINYRAYPEGARVETFSMEQYRRASSALAAAGTRLNTCPDAPDGDEDRASGVVEVAGQLSLDLPEGGRAVRRFEVKLDPRAVTETPSILRTTVLSMRFDDEETVWVPLGDFFCSANAINPMQTLTCTVTADGTLTCRWVMPYRGTASLVLHNLGKQPVMASLSARTEPWSWDDRSMRFHASWRPDEILPGRPFKDWNFVDIHGKGVIVGDAWTVLNPDRGWWGEGDEKIYVDGAYDAGFPTHFGTGTEDYYGWAGGVNPTREDVFSHPFLANASVGSTRENNSRGFNVCTRLRALDAIPFQKRLRLDVEASPGTQIRNPWNLLGYSAVVFWYALPGATSNRLPQPDAAVKPIMSLEQLDAQSRAIRRGGKVKRVPGAIEFEGLKPSATSKGLRCGRQRPAPSFNPDATWSEGEHFFVAGKTVGDFVEFKLTEQFKAAKLLLHVTRSYDFGIVRFSLNGKPVGEDVDLYAPKADTRELDLGLVKPVDNTIALRMELVGKNPKSRASGSYMGLDCVVVRPQ
jgi:hypothetical protein